MRRSVWTIALALPLLAGPALANNEKGEKGHHHESVKMEDLPSAVQDTFRKESSGGQIEELHKMTHKNGEVFYKAEIVKNGKGADLEVNSAGKVVERGKAHDESKENEKHEK
jgi:hypothetical protein